MISGTPQHACERLFVLILLQLLHWAAAALPHTIPSAHPLCPSSRARAAWKQLQQCVVPPQLACICLGPGEEKGLHGEEKRLLKEGLTKQDLPKESVSKGDLPRKTSPGKTSPREDLPREGIQLWALTQVDARCQEVPKLLGIWGKQQRLPWGYWWHRFPLGKVAGADLGLSQGERGSRTR